tara:strand:- start:884 stop:1615 length:732 start_codon:yes stop_codon:yes gene_type:complete
MKGLLTVWRRELSAHFLSPVAYVTMVVYLLVAGWTFVWAVEKNQEIGDPITVSLFVALFLWLPITITVITMGLFAEEKRSGTIETLMTAPVTEWQVVLGKYAGAMTFLLVTMAPSVGYLYIFRTFSGGVPFIDTGALAAGYTILLLVSAFCVSTGLLMSLLTRHQVVAAIACFCAICLPFILRVLSRAVPRNAGAVLEYMATELHILEFARGVVDTRPMVLYLSGTIFMLFLAVRVLESRRWT